MKKVFAIAWKDALVRFSGFSELIFFIILPVIFTFLLAGGTPGGDQDPRMRLLVVDEAKTSISTRIIAELENSSAIFPQVVDRLEAENQFDERRATMVLSIPAGLNQAALQAGEAQVSLRQQPNSLNATVASRAVQTALRKVASAIGAANKSVQEQEKRAPFSSVQAKQDFFEEALKISINLQQNVPQRVNVTTASLTQQEQDYDPRANASAGQMLTWVFIPLFGISELFAYERSVGTLRRLLTTPTSKATYLLGTIAGQVTFALVQMGLLITFGALVMKLDWGRDPAALFVMLLASALAAAAIGTTMGTFVKTSGQANGMSIMAGMLLALLGGCWYPLEMFPVAIQTIVKINPMTWAMQGLIDLLLRRGGMVDILPEAGVLLGFALVFFIIGTWRFRYE
jgi:ABC-2 type transport system permease protein